MAAKELNKNSTKPKNRLSFHADRLLKRWWNFSVLRLSKHYYQWQIHTNLVLNSASSGIWSRDTSGSGREHKPLDYTDTPTWRTKPVVIAGVGWWISPFCRLLNLDLHVALRDGRRGMGVYPWPNFHPFTREFTFDFLFASLHTRPNLKGVYFERKEFAPMGSKFFHFKVDPFLEGMKNNLTELFTLDVYQSLKRLQSYEPCTSLREHAYSNI